MSFETIEISEELGEPITLYKFQYGPEVTDVYTYTDCEWAITFGGLVYAPTPIAHGEISSSGTSDRSTTEIEMDRRGPVPEMFRVYPPSFPVVVTMWQGHANDPTQDYRVVFTGRVLSCMRPSGLLATLNVEPATISLQRVGLRRNWQYMCPHVLYGSQCKANKLAATTAINAYAVSGRLLTLASELTDYAKFLNGMVEWINVDGQREIRTIQAIATVSTRSQLTLSGTAVSVTPGQFVNVIKGCGHVLADCAAIHNNVPNFGGQPYIPLKNPLGLANPFL